MKRSSQDQNQVPGLCNLVAGVVEIMQGMPSKGAAWLPIDRRITVDCVGIWQPVPYGKSSGTVQFLLCSCGFESLFQCQSQRLSSCFSNWAVLGRVVPKVWARVPGEFWKVLAVLGEVQESILGRVLRGSGQRFCIPKGSGENSGFRRFWQKVLRQRSGKKMRNEFGFQHTFPLLGTSPQVTLTCCRGSLFVRMTFAY